MKHALLVFASLLTLGAGAAMAKPALLASAASTAPVTLTPATLTGAERAGVLATASQALNKSRSLQGRFVQIGPDGAASGGVFYLQRPGKLRFQYDAPSPLTIVADGATVAVEDRALKTVDRMPLRATPLYFVLKNNIDLEKDAKITSVTRQAGSVLVTARDKKGETDGQITMVFDGPSMELRQWTITDAQGMKTQLSLKDTEVVATLDPKLFLVKDSKDPTQRRR